MFDLLYKTVHLHIDNASAKYISEEMEESTWLSFAVDFDIQQDCIALLGWVL